MKTNNRLIAEFMGVKPTILGDEITYEMYGIIDCIKDGLDEQHFFLEEELMFHDSWDWLIPVIIKCKESIDYCSDNALAYHNIEDEMLSQLSIEDTYKAVVEFIQEYRLTPKEVV